MSHYERACAIYGGRPERRQVRARYQWRVGNATVSTEELEAWQLGPIPHRCAFVERRGQSRVGGEHGLHL